MEIKNKSFLLQLDSKAHVTSLALAAIVAETAPLPFGEMDGEVTVVGVIKNRQLTEHFDEVIGSLSNYISLDIPKVEELYKKFLKVRLAQVLGKAHYIFAEAVAKNQLAATQLGNQFSGDDLNLMVSDKFAFQFNKFSDIVRVEKELIDKSRVDL